MAEFDRFELMTRYYFIQSVHNQLGQFNLQGHLLDGLIRYKTGFLTPMVGYEFAYYFLDDCKQSYLRANRLIAGLELPPTSHSFYRILYECAFDDYMLPYTYDDDNWDTEPDVYVDWDQWCRQLQSVNH